MDALIQGEQMMLATLNTVEQSLAAEMAWFTAWSGAARSSDLAAHAAQLRQLRGRLLTQQMAAGQLRNLGRPACQQRLEALIQRVSTNLQTFEISYNSRRAYEQAMGGSSGAGGWSAPPEQPGARPGSPGHFDAMMGWRCNWCGGDFRGLPFQPSVCPYCARFPSPGKWAP